MKVELSILLSLATAILGWFFSTINYKRNKEKDNHEENREIKQDTKEETKEKVMLNTKMDILLTNLSEIKNNVIGIQDKLEVSNEKNSQKFSEINERIAIVEQSVKSAHKRIDDFGRKE